MQIEVNGRSVGNVNGYKISKHETFKDIDAKNVHELLVHRNIVPGNVTIQHTIKNVKIFWENLLGFYGIDPKKLHKRLKRNLRKRMKSIFKKYNQWSINEK